MAGFSYKRARNGAVKDHYRKDAQLAASQTVLKGDALILANGELRVATSADTSGIDFIAAQAMTSSTTDIKRPMCVPFKGSNLVAEVPVTPILNEVVASSGSTTTAVVPTSGLSGNDLQYGVVFCKNLGEHRVISASTATSGGSSTITVVEPFSRAIAAGDIISAVPFGIGADPKLADKRTLSSAVADKTGGPVLVQKVDLKRKVAEVVSK